MERVALHESHARFRAIFDAAAIGIALVNLDGCPVESNPALQRMLGYTADELRAMTFAEFTHPDDVDMDMALARELFSGDREWYQIEKRYVCKDGHEIWGRLTASLVRDPGGAPSFGIGMVEDISERVRLNRRRDALLRVARGLAQEADPAHLMRQLLSEAVSLMGGDAGLVARWNESTARLTPVWTTLPLADPPVDIELGQGLGGLAAARRASIVSNDYAGDATAVATVVQAGVRAGVAAPLLYEGRLLGVVTITSSAADAHFSQVDADLLELLGGMASALLVGLERSRLEGVLLAARTAQHALSNQLSAVAGYAELAAADARLPGDLREVLAEAVEGAHGASAVLASIERLTSLEEIDQGAPGGAILHLPKANADSGVASSAEAEVRGRTG